MWISRRGVRLGFKMGFLSRLLSARECHEMMVARSV